VSQEHDHPALLSTELTALQTNWINGAPKAGTQLSAKVRYRQDDQACVISEVNADDGFCRIQFETPQWAVTPGQSVVFYDGDVCLGGGVIEWTNAAAI